MFCQMGFTQTNVWFASKKEIVENNEIIIPQVSIGGDFAYFDGRQIIIMLVPNNAYKYELALEELRYISLSIDNSGVLRRLLNEQSAKLDGISMTHRRKYMGLVHQINYLIRNY